MRSLPTNGLLFAIGSRKSSWKDWAESGGVPPFLTYTRNINRTLVFGT
jgi:hypothetical protein